MFRPVLESSEFDVIEATESEAEDLLSGFAEHWTKFLDEDQKVIEAEIEQKVKEKADEEDRLKSNALFGSW
jgi:hypothetical protein